MDIAIDRNGNSYLFHANYGTGNLYYMTDVTGIWAWEAVQATNSVNVELECNIAIDSNDYIHIVYKKPILKISDMQPEQFLMTAQFQGTLLGQNLIYTQLQ